MHTPDHQAPTYGRNYIAQHPVLQGIEVTERFTSDTLVAVTVTATSLAYPQERLPRLGKSAPIIAMDARSGNSERRPKVSSVTYSEEGDFTTSCAMDVALSRITHKAFEELLELTAAPELPSLDGVFPPDFADTVLNSDLITDTLGDIIGPYLENLDLDKVAADLSAQMGHPVTVDSTGHVIDAEGKRIGLAVPIPKDAADMGPFGDLMSAAGFMDFGRTPAYQPDTVEGMAETIAGWAAEAPSDAPATDQGAPAPEPAPQPADGQSVEGDPHSHTRRRFGRRS